MAIRSAPTYRLLSNTIIACAKGEARDPIQLLSALRVHSLIGLFTSTDMYFYLWMIKNHYIYYITIICTILQSSKIFKIRLMVYLLSYILAYIRCIFTLNKMAELQI